MPVNQRNNKCYLVQRCDYMGYNEYEPDYERDGRPRVIGCYSTAREANQCAKAEAKRLYRDAEEPDVAEPPEVHALVPYYSATVRLYEQFVERIGVYVEETNVTRRFAPDDKLRGGKRFR